jgi:hypothetical protein
MGRNTVQMLRTVPDQRIPVIISSNQHRTVLFGH